MNIEISTEQLRSDISRMREQLDGLSRSMDQVYRCLETVNGMWEGTANTLFAAQTRQDQVELQGLIANLYDLIACMEYAKEQYDKCSEEVDSKIASIRLSNDT